MHNGTNPTILLVDDNPQIRAFIKPALEDSGFNCVEAVDGEEALYQFERFQPDLIVLDIELGDPDLDGLDVCKRIRALDSNVPVIFLTVRSTVEDMVDGLVQAGSGGDYVRKLEELRRLQLEGKNIVKKGPDTQELLVRIQTRLPKEVDELGPELRIKRGQRKVEFRIDQTWKDAQLQPLEYEVFKALVDAKGGVVGTLDLFNRVFQCGSLDADEENSAVDTFRDRLYVCVSNLRAKIGPQKKYDYYIETVQRLGYRFRT